MPYAGGELEFRVWLPAPDVSLPCLLESVAADWRQWERALKEVPVDLALPRFEVEWASPDLRGMFAGLGIGLPWTPGVSFPGFGGAVDPDIRQRVVFDVDETGTRAAAVTESWAVAGVTPPPVEFRVDRPFAFAVVEPAGGNILFIGQYVHAGVPADGEVLAEDEAPAEEHEPAESDLAESPSPATQTPETPEEEITP